MRRRADKEMWINIFIELFSGHMELRIRGNQVQKVIVFSLFLDMLSRDHRKLSDLFMEFLPVAAHFDFIHHDVLGRHKRKLRLQMLLDHLRINLESIGYIQAKIEHTVNSKKAFRYRQPLVCRIIECSLHPLCAGGYFPVNNICHHIPRQRADSLTAHRISLIRHRRGTDLVFLERLFDFLKMLQKANVRSHLHGRSSNAGQRIQNKRIHLPAVSLP